MDSSVLLNEGVHFFCFFADCIQFFVDPNLVRNLFGNNVFDPNYGAHT